MTEPSTDIMLLLRDSTRGEHERAEHHTFQQSLFRGRLPRDDYVAWLGQMYLVHRALESALQRAAPDSAPIRHVVDDHQYQVPYLVEDLEHFDVDPASIEPLAATKRFIDRVAQKGDDSLWLLGLHYVLEGSNNGSRYIAKSVAKAYGLAPGPGLRYLDPYGARQPELWLAFKESMGAVGLTATDGEDLVAAAREMFEVVSEVSDELAAGDAA